MQLRLDLRAKLLFCKGYSISLWYAMRHSSLSQCQVKQRQKKMRSLALLQMLKCRAHLLWLLNCGILKKAINPVLYYSSQKLRWYSSTNGNFNTISTTNKLYHGKVIQGSISGRKQRKRKEKKRSFSILVLLNCCNRTCFQIQEDRPEVSRSEQECISSK